MEKQRHKKLESVSKEIISNLIFEELPDEENIFGIITVTKVVISSDLSYLDVWVSSLNNGNILAKTLAKYNLEIQKKYFLKVNIRKVPRIRYRYDGKGELSQKICDTINKIGNMN